MTDKAFFPGKILLGVCALLLALWVQPALAQNLIVNGGFENNPPPNNGNNIGWSIAPWTLGPGNSSNVVKVYNSDAIYNYGNNGPMHDASNNGAGAGVGVVQHYLDIANGANDFYQVFTVPTCGSAAGQTRTATFSGWFSTRENRSGTGGITIRSGAGLSGTILGQQSVTLPAPVSPQTSKTAGWQQVTGTVSVNAGSQVSFIVSMDNNVNFDEAYLSFEDVTCVTSQLTMRKTWAQATVNDTAALSVTRGGIMVDSLASTANASSETDVDATPLLVFQGETLELAETLGASNAGLYTSGLACTGGGTLSGTTLTVGNTGAAITCTYTNTGRLAKLSITKSNGVNQVVRGQPFNYSIVVSNTGDVNADGSIVSDPAVAGLSCSAITCGSEAGGAVCPTGVTVAGFHTGVAIPTFPAGGAVTFTMTCTADP